MGSGSSTPGRKGDSILGSTRVREETIASEGQPGPRTAALLPFDDRACELLKLSDLRYSVFASQLPRPLSETAQLKSTFMGPTEEGKFLGPSSLSPGPATAPWLFWELLNGLSDELFLDLAEAGLHLTLASILLDHQLDGQCDATGPAALLHQTLYSTSLRKYRSLFPPSSGFWTCYERLSDEHVRGLAAEIEAQSRNSGFSLDRFRDTSYGKAAPIVACLASFLEATGQRSVLSPVEGSIKALAAGSQLLDDIHDWEEDAERGHLTYFLTQLATLDPWPLKDRLAIPELGQRLDVSWFDVDQLRHVTEWFSLALDCVRGIECPTWVAYVQNYLSLADDTHTMLIARHLRVTLARMPLTQRL